MLNRKERAVLRKLEANDTLIIVLGQTDKHHYLVLNGLLHGAYMKRYTAEQIVLHNNCHYNSDCGIWEIREMFEWGEYAYFFKHFPQETILTLANFMNGKEPQITEWMTQKQFKATVFELSAEVDRVMPHTQLKNFRRFIRKSEKEAKERRKREEFGLKDKHLQNLGKHFTDDNNK